MMKTYVYATGGKGGVGKSLMSMLFADYLAMTKDVLLIDTDMTNSDCYAVYKNGKQSNIECKVQQLRSEDTSGQVDVSGLMATFDDDRECVVVDAPAGDTVLLSNAGGAIAEMCAEYKAKSTIAWMVDSADRTGVNALNAAIEQIKSVDLILLIRNYKTSSDFDFFENSKTIEKIKALGNVRIIDLPKVASRITQRIRIDRASFAQMCSTDTPVGDRVEARRIRALMHRTLENVGL
ncbi:hypothetical protein [Polaromonas sp.]|uniref:nucleotide-binding protein n=1 Tax=Polaromonas sp. TaxID=1869339 RepID=UPI0025F7CE10|nr:hypothetical protein [Polaromonas sp.]